MNITEPKEIEFKYSAKDISIRKFHEFCKNLESPYKYINPTGPDYFYSKQKNEFVRVRVFPSGEKELTYKKKTSENDSYVRVEHNIPISSDATVDQLSSFLYSLGYEYQSHIMKHCLIYAYEDYSLVYYIVYDHNMAELGRFFEIEPKEGLNNEKDTFQRLLVLEKLCIPLGIDYTKRIKHNLYEMFVEDK